MRLLCFIVVLNSAVGAAQPGLFDPDPAHLWNRLHSALWLRFDGVGEMFGADRLDPLLWRDTQALLVGESHERALQVLEEFAAIDGAAQGLDPQKKPFYSATYGPSTIGCREGTGWIRHWCQRRSTA